MAEITAAMVKELRERTQAGMSDCKNALVEAAGDMDKAIENIMKKGLLKGQAKAGRVASEGEVRAVVEAEGRRAVIVEVNCQTDFVARGDAFRDFVGKVVDVARKATPGADLNAEKFPGSDNTVDTERLAMVGKTGENTVIRRWAVVEAKEPNGVVHSYIHMGGKLAVLLHAEAPSADAAKSADFTAFVENCAMQIAAMRPTVVSKEQVDPAQLAKQKEIFEGQLREEKKPEAAWPKIIDGKVQKWFTEVTLLGQDNVWDQGKGTIDKLRQDLGKQLGGEVMLHDFVRFELGEGIEKKTDDLATEVAKMTGA